MDKDAKKMYEKQAKDLLDEINACDYSNGYQVICCVEKLAQLVITLFQEIEVTEK